MAKKKPLSVDSETRRLRKIFAGLPAGQLAVVDGLIIQAARLRVQLNEVYEDLVENGRTEMFQQSEKCEPYERERPAAAQFVKLDKSYQSVIKQLVELAPTKAEGGRLEALMRDG